MQRHYARIALAVSALLTSATLAPAFAATLTWPTSPGCTGTLQACINSASNNDRIEIASDTPIAESLTIQGKNLSLTAAVGYKPTIRNGGIIANSSGSDASIDVRISKLRFLNSFVTCTYAAAGRANFELRDLDIEHEPGFNSPGIQIIAYSSTVTATVYNNRVKGVPFGSSNGLIRLTSDGGTLNANAYFNRVTSTAPGTVAGAGIVAEATSISSGTIKLHGNEVRGGFTRAGIFVSETRTSTTATAFNARVYNNVIIGNDSGSGSGIGIAAKDTEINAQIVNNTITRQNFGLLAYKWETGVTPRVTGIIQNNLIVSNTAIFINPGMEIANSNDYNLVNGTVTNVMLGANSITAPAALASDSLPRLTAASPAIDAADATVLGLGLILNGLPTTDADGLRRYKRMTTGEKPDIGAYEYGDVSILHKTSAGTIAGHISRIDDNATNNRPDANVFATPNFDSAIGAGVSYNRAFGLFYPSPRWAVYNQETAVAMPQNVLFNLFIPAAGAGNLRHTTTADNTANFSSELSASGLTNQPDMIVLATHNWSAGQVYNPHPIGVFSFGLGADTRWYVANLDQTNLPTGLGFSIYYQQPSPNAFRVQSTSANAAYIELDHPLLNDIPCARVMVTRMWQGSPVTAHFDTYFATGTRRWRIYSYSPMPLGTQFNVLVDPAQVAACTERIFSNGFE